MQHGVVWSKVLEFVIYFLIVSPPKCAPCISAYLAPVHEQNRASDYWPIICYSTCLPLPYRNT